MVRQPRMLAAIQMCHFNLGAEYHASLNLCNGGGDLMMMSAGVFSRIGTNGQPKVGFRLKLNSCYSSCFLIPHGAMIMLRTIHRSHKVLSATRQTRSDLGAAPSRWPNKCFFSRSTQRCLAVAEMRHEDLAGLRINQDRLMNDIHSTCEWGKGERWGE